MITFIRFPLQFAMKTYFSSQMRPFYQLLFDYRTDRAFITPENDLHFITGIVIQIFVIITMMMN